MTFNPEVLPSEAEGKEGQVIEVENFSEEEKGLKNMEEISEKNETLEHARKDELAKAAKQSMRVDNEKAEEVRQNRDVEFKKKFEGIRSELFDAGSSLNSAARFADEALKDSRSIYNVNHFAENLNAYLNRGVNMVNSGLERNIGGMHRIEIAADSLRAKGKSAKKIKDLKGTLEEIKDSGRIMGGTMIVASKAINDKVEKCQEGNKQGGLEAVCDEILEASILFSKASHETRTLMQQKSWFFGRAGNDFELHKKNLMQQLGAAMDKLFRDTSSYTRQLLPGMISVSDIGEYKRPGDINPKLCDNLSKIADTLQAVSTSTLEKGRKAGLL